MVRRLGRAGEATDAHRAALRLESVVPERDFTRQRITEMGDS